MPPFYKQIKDQWTKLPYPLTDVTGKTIIVTGSNSGLGLEAARHFVRLNASRVILAVRTVSKGEQAKADIEATTGKKGVAEVWSLDMSSFDSIKDFCKRAKNSLDRVDIVLENAAACTATFELVEEMESQITVNVLGTFLMALLLMPKLQQTSRKFNTSPRLVFVSSSGHMDTSFEESKYEDIFDALATESKSSMMDRYMTSKLLGLWAVREMARYFPIEKTGVIINMSDPGFCKTGLWSDIPWFIRFYLNFMSFLIGRTAEVGSRNFVSAAIARPESHGSYISECRVANDKVGSLVWDEEGCRMQRKIWEGLIDWLKKVEPDILEKVSAL